MYTKELPPVELLRALFDYDPETGILMRKLNRRGGVKAGDIVNYSDRDGYLIVGVCGARCKVHRIAYSHFHGRPIQTGYVIDHLDGNRSNNRIVNLREATLSQNGLNRKKDTIKSNTGVRGVYWQKTKGYYTAWLSTTYLGKFFTLEEAAAARLQAEVTMLQSVTTP